MLLERQKERRNKVRMKVHSKNIRSFLKLGKRHKSKQNKLKGIPIKRYNNLTP